MSCIYSLDPFTSHLAPSPGQHFVQHFDSSPNTCKNHIAISFNCTLCLALNRLHVNALNHNGNMVSVVHAFSSKSTAATASVQPHRAASAAVVSQSMYKVPRMNKLMMMRMNH